MRVRVGLLLMHLRLLLTCSPEWAPQRTQPYPLCEGPLHVMCGVAQFQGLCVGWRSLPPALPHLGGGLVDGGGGWRLWWVSLPAMVVVPYEMLPHNPTGGPTTHSLPCVSLPPPTLRRYGGRLLPASPPSTLAMCVLPRLSVWFTWRRPV